ncbi:hypothetical protein [Crateriforma spongiae]|uniref:hypothetical protein n=1 Tax=Crateriforma spongiae TaxID=2724528 RepID=UPI0014458612|nr:hypothetical protein [Crateriforma spongiae]
MQTQKLLILFVALVWSLDTFAQIVMAADDDTALDNYYVSRSEDDAEEGTNGEVDLANEDLDLGQLSGFESAAKIGIRFDGIRMHNERKIERAFVQFTMEGNRIKSKPTTLTIRAELSPDAESFKKDAKNISSRELTKESVTWSPEPWDPKRARDEKPQTPDLSALIQEVVDQTDWVEGNALVFIISGEGERDAVSFDGDRKNAPMLYLVTD